MRLHTWKPWSLVCASLLALTVACGDDKGDGDAEAGNTETAGDGDGDPATGDGDGSPGDGDGSPGDGDGAPGDGDGAPGDGDGAPGDGDGDGAPGDGDGDGDPNSPCFDIGDQAECDANAECQSVIGSPVKQNGPDAPCFEPQEFLGCIPMQGCGDALTWFCVGGNAKPYLVPDTCGPQDGELCDAPADSIPECP